jgi:hypothetical protein
MMRTPPLDWRHCVPRRRLELPSAWALTSRIASDRIRRVRLRWATSATKHGIARNRTRHVVDNARLIHIIRAQPPARPTDVLLFTGDDQRGVALEVMGVELTSGELLVIHSMPLRPKKFGREYKEAQQWQQP